MAVFLDGTRWRYRTVVALVGPLPPKANGEPRHRVNARGGFETRIHGAPTVNTRAAAERAEREHISRVEQEATVARYAPTTLINAPTLSVWFRGTVPIGSADQYNGRYWTEHVVGEKENRQGTRTEKRRAFERYLEPTLGPMKLDTIDLGTVNALRATLKATMGRRGTPLAEKTRANALAILANALRYAANTGVIQHAPAIIVRAVKAPPIECWTFEEYGRLLGAAAREGEPFETAVLLAGEAGLRIGEILGLEWAHLDLVANTITVQQQIRHGVIGPPKSGVARTVPMTPRLASHLRGVPRIRNGRVVAVAGEAVREGETGHAIRRMCRYAGLPEAQWHRLRHTFATHAALLGANPIRLMHWLGHSGMTMTLRYVHFAEAHEWPIADEILTAGAELLHPDRRLVVQLGARPAVAPRAEMVTNRNHVRRTSANPQDNVVIATGIEPVTYALGKRRSIQLS